MEKATAAKEGGMEGGKSLAGLAGRAEDSLPAFYLLS